MRSKSDIFKYGIDKDNKSLGLKHGRTTFMGKFVSLKIKSPFAYSCKLICHVYARIFLL